MWETPPFTPVIKDGRMYGRGACDMKSGTIGALYALDAIKAAGLKPTARIHFQSVIEEESTGVGALSTLQRGYRADACFIPEPTNGKMVRSQVGVIWFRLKVRGHPVHVFEAGSGFGFPGKRPSRCARLRASLRARRIASAFSRALRSDGFS